MTYTDVLSDRLLKPLGETRPTPKLRLRRRGEQASPDIKDREGLELADPSTLTTGHAGQQISMVEIERERTKSALIDLILLFGYVGLSYNAGEDAKVDPVSIEAALSLLIELPADRPFHNVSPDGEGGLMMVWDDPLQALLLTVDSWRLHAVVNPATSRSQHVDVIPFDGETVPQKLLDLIPKR